jgi:hypothetical protein
MADSLEVRIQSGPWRSRLNPTDHIEVWQGDHLVTCLPGGWLIAVIDVWLSMARLTGPFITAVQSPRTLEPPMRKPPAPARTARRRHPPVLPRV